MLSSKVRVGLDIGSHSIKAVVVEKSGNRFKVVHRAVRPLWGGGNVFDPDGPKRGQIVPQLMDLFASFKMAPKRLKNIRSLIAGSQVAAKEIIAVPLEDREMASAMLLEARKHIPLDGSDTQVDYQVLGEHHEESDKVRVLLVASSKKQFEGHLQTLKEIEVRPTVVDIEPLAYTNSYLAFNDLPDEGLVVLVDIGCRKTSITLMGRKDRFFTREVPVGGQAFTDELIKNYGLSWEEAEKVKAEQGLKPDLPKADSESGELRLASKSTIDRFGEEVNRTLRYYVKETGQSHFTKFVLVGGGAGLEDVRDYLANKFNASAEVYDPFAFMDVTAENGGGHPSQYAAAVGLAIREV
ncbi:pilus assembly protein PilM [bacterium]|nr:pilus assembly protein PilM [bacterium]